MQQITDQVEDRANTEIATALPPPAKKQPPPRRTWPPAIDRYSNRWKEFRPVLIRLTELHQEDEYFYRLILALYPDLTPTKLLTHWNDLVSEWERSHAPGVFADPKYGPKFGPCFFRELRRRGALGGNEISR